MRDGVDIFQEAMAAARARELAALKATNRVLRFLIGKAEEKAAAIAVLEPPRSKRRVMTRGPKRAFTDDQLRQALSEHRGDRLGAALKLGVTLACVHSHCARLRAEERTEL